MQTSLQQKIESVVETPFQQDVSGLKIAAHKHHWRSHPTCEQGSGLSTHVDLVLMSSATIWALQPFPLLLYTKGMSL